MNTTHCGRARAMNLPATLFVLILAPALATAQTKSPKPPPPVTKAAVQKPAAVTAFELGERVSLAPNGPPFNATIDVPVYPGSVAVYALERKGTVAGATPHIVASGATPHFVTSVLPDYGFGFRVLAYLTMSAYQSRAAIDSTTAVSVSVPAIGSSYHIAWTCSFTNPSTVHVTWQPVPGATSYTLFIQHMPGGGSVTTVTKTVIAGGQTSASYTFAADFPEGDNTVRVLPNYDLEYFPSGAGTTTVTDYNMIIKHVLKNAPTAASQWDACF